MYCVHSVNCTSSYSTDSFAHHFAKSQITTKRKPVPAARPFRNIVLFENTSDNSQLGPTPHSQPERDVLGSLGKLLFCMFFIFFLQYSNTLLRKPICRRCWKISVEDNCSVGCLLRILNTVFAGPKLMSIRSQY